METTSLKKPIASTIIISLIFCSLSLMLSAMGAFDVFSPVLKTLLEKISIMPIIFMCTLIENLFNSINKEKKFLKISILTIFLSLVLIFKYISLSIIGYGSL